MALNGRETVKIAKIKTKPLKIVSWILEKIEKLKESYG